MVGEIKTRLGRISIASFLLVVVLNVSSRGGDLKSYNSLILNVHEQSVRSLGAAGAYASIADDESSFYLNPAGLARLVKQRKLSIQSRILTRAKDFGLLASVIDGKTEAPLSWGFAFNWARTEEDWHQDFILDTAYNYKNFIMVGLQSKFSNFNTALFTKDFWLYSVDGGVLAFLGDYISIGVTAKNLVRTRGDHAPYRLLGGITFNARLLRLSAESERDFSNKRNILRTGLEIRPFQAMILRGGFFWSPKDGQNERGYSVGTTTTILKTMSLEGAFTDRLSSNFRSFFGGISVTF